jgi:hypothetical protein
MFRHFDAAAAAFTPLMLSLIFIASRRHDYAYCHCRWLISPLILPPLSSLLRRRHFLVTSVFAFFAFDASIFLSPFFDTDIRR